MLKGTFPRKAVAATFLAILFTQTFAPAVAYALTSGPTQPEATSFEPIDTTDMVNMQTGSFTYNMPLLEVPGSEGGYPLSLSYHAGIQPNEDASWVGLGWTLNPGSITRSVNGYPDDWQWQTNTSRVYWNGGQTTTYTVGLNVGIANTPATVGFGLSFSQDTYRGFGVGFDLSLGGGLQLGPVNAYASVGLTSSPYGGDVGFGASAGIGIGGSVDGLTGSLGMNVNTNFKSVSSGFTGGIGYDIKNASGGSSMHGSLLGTSLSTGGGKPSLSMGGLTASVSNSKAGKISTESHGFHVDVPVFFGVNLSFGYNKTRYWTDETVNVTTHGSLFPTLPSIGTKVYDDISYDSYSLLEDGSYKNIIDYPDPKTVQGGAFPDFDVYNVNAQGLAGSMRPYLFQGTLLNQNIKNGSTPKVTYYAQGQGATAAVPFFRFENDFSNSYRQNYPAYDPGTISDMRYIAPPMDPSPVYGNNDGTFGYGSGNALAGSKHVDVGIKIHPVNDLGYNSAQRLQPGMIEGFSITNESGMVYHFGLPAYSYGEENYQQNTTYQNGYPYNRQTKPAPYAYTWYLTTITGPDFVDRNNDGKADDGDWGYWVNFQYGKWSDDYVWRNPSEGFKLDEDNQFEDCSIGHKEIYYLNAIRTRTHIALFEKDLRQDAKGESQIVFASGAANLDPLNNPAQSDYYHAGLFDISSSQSLLLSHIYLLNASDENFVTAASGPSYAYMPPTRNGACTTCELASNVLDKTDVDAVGRAALEAKAIRVIDMRYDYSSCPGTTNSFDSYGTGFTFAKNGKLTLKNVVARGKGGANLLPPTSFSYELTAAEQNAQPATVTGYTFITATNAYKVGDLIMQRNTVAGGPDIFLGPILKVDGSGPYTYTTYHGPYTSGSVQATVFRTKDPPYDKNAYDMWGLYKDDVASSALNVNENIGRYTSVFSSASVDAWSLRTITTPLGSQIKVNYESGTYKQSALDNNYSFILSNISSTDRKTLIFNIETYSSSQDPLTIAPIGAKFNPVVLLVSYGMGSQQGTGAPVHKITATNLGNLTITGYNPTPSGLMGHYTGVLDIPVPASVSVQGQGGSTYGAAFSGFYTGNAYKSINTDFYGGGVRVASLSINNTTDNSITTTSYNYNDPATGRSSGITSYLPTELDAYDALAANRQDPDYSYPNLTQELTTYKETLYKNASLVYSLGRELPPPAVMYQYVTVTNQVQSPYEQTARSLPGSTQYQFEVFNPNMVGISDVTPRTQGSNSYGAYRSRNAVLQKFTGAIGNLLRTVKYDANGAILSETINHYLHDPYRNAGSLSAFMTGYKSALAQYFYQGYLQERYSEVKEVENQTSASDNAVLTTLSAREEFPCIQTGQTVINYVNGTQSSSQNLAFDFYSGAVTQTVETDAYGNNFMTQTVPAYRQYSPMGLKINANSNANMLTQTAATYRWKVDGSNNRLGLVSAGISTWSNAVPAVSADGTLYTQNGANGNVWRPQSVYGWMPTGQTSDGLTPYASFTDFSWSNPGASDPRWVKSSDITLYDVYSRALEAKDLNNNYVATRMNYKEQKVILTGGPANYYELAYSGAEDAALNQTNNLFVKAADGTATSVTAHTGAQSLLLGTSGKRGFLYTVPIVTSGSGGVMAGQTYMASVWVKPASGTMSGVKLYYSVGGTVKGSTSGASAKTAGAWSLVNLAINGSDLVSGSTLAVWCQNDNTSVQAYVDDMRFQPQGASTTAYVYDPFSGELTHVLDNSNLYTRFEYDAAGRLVRTYKEKMNIGEFKTNQYQYNYSATNYASAAITDPYAYAKNTCPLYYSGTSAPTMNIPAGRCTSFISQADADAQAAILAQDYANMNGGCICTPKFTYAAGIIPVLWQLNAPNSTIKFTLFFQYPAGATTVDLGTIAGSCGLPTAVRTVPILIGSSTFNVIISPSGSVQIKLISGPAPGAGSLSFSGTYDTQVNLSYSNAKSGTFTKSCTPPQIGSSVTYLVPQYKYAAIDQTTADNLAAADVQANGQAAANADPNATCSTPCSFSRTSSLTWLTSTVSSTSGTSAFKFVFISPSNGYSFGTLGTITGGCLPSLARSVHVTDAANTGRVWNVSISTTGGVQITLFSGTAPTAGVQISLQGTYSL